MAAPKQAASGAKRDKRDKGTRGGRPDPQAAASRRSPAQPAKPRSASPAAGAAAAVASPARPATRIPPLWFQLTTWILSIAGLGMSTYLTITHYDSAVPLACSDNGVINCALVTSSPQSMVFGVFPVAVLGLAFYVFLAVANAPWAWRSKYPQVAMARLASMIVGIGFVLYLIYTELFTLDHICLLCTSVHVITFLLFVLILISAAVGYGFRNPDRA
jgi:uncharacterized membrane protein